MDQQVFYLFLPKTLSRSQIHKPSAEIPPSLPEWFSVFREKGEVSTIWFFDDLTDVFWFFW